MSAEESLANDEAEDVEVVVGDMSDTVIVFAYHCNDFEVALVLQAVEVAPDRFEPCMAKKRTLDYYHLTKESTSSNSCLGSRMDFEQVNEDVVVWDNESAATTMGELGPHSSVVPVSNWELIDRGTRGSPI